VHPADEGVYGDRHQHHDENEVHDRAHQSSVGVMAPLGKWG
jgi:hypothetical protein